MVFTIGAIVPWFIAKYLGIKSNYNEQNIHHKAPIPIYLL